MTFLWFKPKRKLRLAFLISGNGTTMDAIIRACHSGKLRHVEPVLVISSSGDALGIGRAKNLWIPDKDVLVLRPQDFNTSEEFGQKIISECKLRNVNFIGQYGWMVKTPDNVIEAFKDSIINQHPGPLDNGRPDFGGAGMYGMRVIQARYEFVHRVNRDFWTEATAHRVTEVFDKGAIIKRVEVPILPNDTPLSLRDRLLPIEHKLQIEALKDFVRNRVTLFHREKPLILPGEEKILEECKQHARELYPNG